jgi:hypothetical protein
MPISAGQPIGIDSTNGADQLGVASVTGASVLAWIPPLADGSTAAGSSFPNQEYGFNADVVAQPGVTSISPSSAPDPGGTLVTIAGHDFLGATAVSFGGIAARSYTVHSDTSITAVSPTASPGTVDVTVTTAGGRSPTSAADRFTFTPLPRVSSVSPSSGPRIGGTRVSIAGHDFTGASAVRFDGVPARNFTVKSDSLITAASPAHTPGQVDITVSTPRGLTAVSAADRFKFNQVCVVPKLKGKTLKAAKKALKKAHCRLGKVRPKGQTTGTVKHQSRKPRKVLKAGSKVNVKLG